jgi:predicted naringenin-chalcone synthase
MKAYIHNIVSAVPEPFYDQSLIRERTKLWLNASPKVRRYIDAIYNASAIEKRHSVIDDADAFFEPAPDGSFTAPSTGARNDLFTAAAGKIFVDLARRAVETCDSFDYPDITHLITVSCTGFFRPGPDCLIIKSLGLNPNVARFNIGFQGCCAAFPAMRLADSICRADPDAVVLVICVELCTLHAQLTDDTDSLLGGALFADGGAAALISAQPPPPEKPAYRIDSFESAIIPSTNSEMAWTITDSGFRMVLSQYIPDIIAANIREILRPALSANGMKPADIEHWAVHPGGRSILDKIESALNIEGRLDASRSVLRNYGNMSSATILFVLKELLRTAPKRPAESVFALAFGPGLTVETAILHKLAPVRADLRKPHNAPDALALESRT